MLITRKWSSGIFFHETLRRKGFPGTTTYRDATPRLGRLISARSALQFLAPSVSGYFLIVDSQISAASLISHLCFEEISGWYCCPWA
jgi:hypothetical protein